MQSDFRQLEQRDPLDKSIYLAVTLGVFDFLTTVRSLLTAMFVISIISWWSISQTSRSVATARWSESRKLQVLLPNKLIYRAGLFVPVVWNHFAIEIPSFLDSTHDVVRVRVIERQPSMIIDSAGNREGVPGDLRSSAAALDRRSPGTPSRLPALSIIIDGWRSITLTLTTSWVESRKLGISIAKWFQTTGTKRPAR